MSTPPTSSTTSTPAVSLVLSNLTADVDQFVQQFQAFLQQQPVWVGNLTTQTSETLIELISTVGTFAQGRIIRESEDAFAETAQSDSAILSITQMQGLRIARFLPAQVPASITSPVSVTLAPYTQFSAAGSFFFNRDALTFEAGVPLDVTLFEGQLFSYQMNGLGTERQTFVGSQDSFVVSDQDVTVQVNSTIIPKAYGGLWNFDGLPGYADITTSDGRLLLQFGNLGGTSAQFGALQAFGTLPQVTDSVVVTYPVTQGATGNSLTTLGTQVTVTGFPLIFGVMTGNPQGGANQNPTLAYKNVASGGFGTYQSAVTKSQYLATIATFPGIVDAVTQAQREINPNDLRWMNVIRVSALTTSPWSQAQILEFTNFCQTVSMFACYFLFQAPIPVPRTVAMNVYIFNSALPQQVQKQVTNAIVTLFSPRPGLLMTNFYESDLERAASQSSPGQISHVEILSPTGPMIVTSPTSPQITFTLVPGGGSLAELVYAYAISTTLQNGQVGTPVNWVFPQVISTTADFGVTLTWPSVMNAATYTVWGRAAGSGLGILTTVTATNADTYTFTDNGTLTPTGGPPTTIADTPIQYNTLASAPVINVFFSERQQQIDSSTPSRSSIG
jgi:hypothetical protein